MRWTGWGVALLLTLMLGAVPADAATTYTVSGQSDPPGATCTGTVCASLRAAVTNLPSGGTIQLGSGIYKLSGVLQIGQSETIVGLSPAQTTIQQTKVGDGVIEASTGDLSLSQLTITGGRKLGRNGFDQFAAGPTLVLSAREFGPSPLNCQVTAAGTYGQSTPDVATLQMPTNCNCTPKITTVGQSHRTWRRGGRLARLSAVATRPPVGTTFTFTLDRAATVTLSFTRTSNGRVVHRRCVPLTRANRRDRACTTAKAAGSMTFKALAGANKITFQGRLSKRKRLATGNYLLGITAAVSGGPSSKPSTLRFNVVN